MGPFPRNHEVGEQIWRLNSVYNRGSVGRVVAPVSHTSSWGVHKVNFALNIFRPTEMDYDNWAGSGSCPMARFVISTFFRLYLYFPWYKRFFPSTWPYFSGPRVVSKKNMVRSPSGPGTKNDCSDEGQQQFTRPDPTRHVSYNVFSKLLSKGERVRQVIDLCIPNISMVPRPVVFLQLCRYMIHRWRAYVLRRLLFVGE
jgi:hypothetical protein